MFSGDIDVSVFDREIQEGEIELAMRLFLLMKWLRYLLAAAVAFAYFGGHDWAMDAVIVSIILLLAAPLGFFDVFIQKLVEYNASTIDGRLKLNAEQANRAFADVHRKIDGKHKDDA